MIRGVSGDCAASPGLHHQAGKVITQHLLQSRSEAASCNRAVVVAVDVQMSFGSIPNRPLAALRRHRLKHAKEVAAGMYENLVEV